MKKYLFNKKILIGLIAFFLLGFIALPGIGNIIVAQIISLPSKPCELKDDDKTRRFKAELNSKIAQFKRLSYKKESNYFEMYSILHCAYLSRAKNERPPKCKKYDNYGYAMRVTEWQLNRIYHTNKIDKLLLFPLAPFYLLYFQNNWTYEEMAKVQDLKNGYVHCKEDS